MTKMAYRPEIDGLRSLAVLAVMLYHLKLYAGTIGILPGGFLGVDVFFVLSGFLISQIILTELRETGSISFRNFYIRRARRILPPLFLVILVTLPVAWAILLPSELERFAKSLLAAVFFYSNAFWFLELSEYGAQSGLLQPFLHTWSLAIEEQFYIFFPVFLLLLHRYASPKTLWISLVTLIPVFFVLCLLTTGFHKNLSFFSPVSRVWELLAGATLGYLALHHPQMLRGHRLSKAVPALALVVLMVALTTVHLETSDHPGFVTVPVIAATCALLWFAAPNEPVTRFFSRRGPVWIGKLSYSLYLWHFPIYAFGRQLSLGTPTWWEMTIWVALTFALSWLGYRLIERPFRFQLPLRPFFGSLAMVLAGILAFTVTISQGGGYPARFANLTAAYGANEIDNERLRDESWGVLADLSGGDDFYNHRIADQPSRFETGPAWYQNPDSYRILVLGNSHAKDFFNALYLNADLFVGMEFARFGMHGSFPQEQIDQLLQTPNFQQADAVAIAPRYSRDSMTRLPALLEEISASGKAAYVVGNTSEFISPGEAPVFDWYMRRGGSTEPSKINAVSYDYESESGKQRNTVLRSIAEAHGVTYLPRRDLICEDVATTCALVTPEGLKTMYDYGHWTVAGATYFGSLTAEKGWFSAGSQDTTQTN